VDREENSAEFLDEKAHAPRARSDIDESSTSKEAAMMVPRDDSDPFQTGPLQLVRSIDVTIKQRRTT
jgi:hypothetical protein